MGAATERAVGVNHTAAGFAIQHWANAVVFGQFLAAGGAKGFGGEQRFAFGEMRGEAGELELAAFGAGDAIPLHGTFGQVLINGPHFGENVGNGFWHG